MREHLLPRSCLSLPEYPGVQHIISQQAAQTPGMLAVVCGKQYLTYAQLERQANQLAHALLRREIRSGVCVALYLDRSLDLLVSLLAVLKAGGCFLLLEAGTSSPYLLDQLAACDVSLLLTQQRLSQHAIGYRGEVLCLDRDQFLWVGESSSAPPVSSTDEQPASLFYTSPQKYTQINQRALLTACLNALEQFPSEPGWQSTLSLSQPAHLELLFSPLLSGGYLHFC